MRSFYAPLAVLFLSCAALSFGQGATGTITGTVSDPAGAVIAGAKIEAKNSGTGVSYSAASTNAGVYTIADLPVGTYVVTATVSGFKTYTHTNIAMQAAQILREDIPLQVGSSTESVTVTAEATLLKTETGDLAHNVTIDQLDELPLLGIGTTNAGTSGYRNPYNTLLTLPGVSNYNSSGTFEINGLGQSFVSTETMRIEGQDATSRIFGIYDYTQMAQPGADSIQEIAYQTSNYAPEFGQAASVVINMTMKSGTNQYHGSGYDYFVNEDLNAGNPFTISPVSGGKMRPRNRRNDFGGTLGGPIYIPKVYNGHNKSFFFFSYEQFLESTFYNDTDTVPVPAYLGGDFSAISANGNCSLCAQYGIPKTALANGLLDPGGNPLYANTIYDPLSWQVAASGKLAGQGFATPFLNNQISPARFDPVSVKLLSLISSLGVKPNVQGALVNNYAGTILGGRYSAIPSIKIDHNISAKDKLSFYYSENNTESQISGPLGNQDGLPQEIGGYRGTFIPTYTERLNYDRTLTPTLLLHLGGGYYHTSFSDRAPFLKFNQSLLGLQGFIQARQFPSFTGLNCDGPPTAFGCPTTLGGMQNVGTAGQGQSLSYEEKPSFNGNLTWVKGKHTYKAGIEMYLEQDYSGSISGVTMATGVGPTGDPFTPSASLAGYSTGFGFASFLLGDYTGTTQTPYRDPREGQQVWGMFVQDSWKVTRKLTVDYGIRYDLDTAEHEQYGRIAQLNPSAANTNAGGRLGTFQYAQTCGCSFYKNAYPYALGPRIGVAYQIDPKTVFRAGWGLVYQFVASPAGSVIYTNGAYPVAANSPAYIPSGNQYVNIETPGSIVAPAWPVFSPSIFPVPGTVGGQTPGVPDANQNRPPRINQFSAGFQREITRNTIIEASYVGNRAVWLGGFPSGPLAYFSQVSPQAYASYGLFPYPGTGPCATGGGVCTSSTYNNDADRNLLSQQLSSAAVAQAAARTGRASFLPYAGFPTSQSLASALYPYPQFGNIGVTGSPTNDSKYDSLQVKLTKRLSHSLQAGGAYTWGQGFNRAVRQDLFNPASGVWALQQIPLQTLSFNLLYTTPKASFFPKWANAITNGWLVGFFGNYQSGAFLTPPSSPTLNFLTSEDIRNPGVPLYTPGVDINNLNTYNPLTTQVLNPAAWKACPTNAACMASGNYYKDFRAPRIPMENGNLGRNFRMGKEGRYNLYIRGDFVNLFNRTLMPAPSTAVNPANPVTRGGPAGQLTAGFGVINAYLAPGTSYGTPPYLLGRTGTLIARFSF